MNKYNYSAHVRVNGTTGEKLDNLARMLETSIQLIACKLLDSVIDEATENTKKFLASFDQQNKKQFLEIFNGTLKEWNKKAKK